MKKVLTWLPVAFALLFFSCNNQSDSDSSTSTTETTSNASSIQGVDSVGIQLVASDLVAPLYLTQPPGDNRLFVVDQIGVVRVIRDGQLQPDPYLDLTKKIIKLKDEHEERGLLGLAFHPDFQNNGRLFVFYSAPLRASAPNNFDHTNVVAEFRVSANNRDQVDLSTERILLQEDHPQYNHNAGNIQFGPDGYLYISIGDGGNKNDIGTGHVADWYQANDGGNGQDIRQNLRGNILRIDVNSGSPYAVPADNPFANDSQGLKEVYAYGLRNPYRFSFDKQTGMLIAGDAGQVLREEINVITKGGNYGWNVKEGTICFNAANNKDSLATCPNQDSLGNSFIDPVIEFKNSMTYPQEGLGIVCVGGYVYRGQTRSELNGNYLFGVWTQHHDKPDGAVFAAGVTEGRGNWRHKKLHFRDRPNAALGHYLLGFGQDNNGEMYLLVSDEHGPHGNTGKIYRIM